MEPTQAFLHAIVKLANSCSPDEEGTWYRLVPGDPEEFTDDDRSPIGLLVKIAGDLNSGYRVINDTTYNR
jgi:hypothetical protein